jgi:hypothetical protein
MKFTGLRSATYEPATNLVKARFITASGQPLDVDIDGEAFMNLMGQANLTNESLRHRSLNQDMPLMVVAGFQMGTAQVEGTDEKQLVLSLIVPQLGKLNFVFPPPAEAALRERLQPKAE